MDNPKQFLALVNGAFLRTFQNDESITPQLLKEEVFPEDTPTIEDVTSMLQTVINVAKDAAKHDMELSDLENYLAKTSLSEMQQQAILRAWRSNRMKVHESLRKDAQWNNALKDFTWRIDVKTKAMADTKAELNEPSAIVQLSIGSYSHDDEVAEMEGRLLESDRVIRFEMSKEKLTEVVYQINQIQAQIVKISEQS